MPQTTKQQELQALLRPLSEQFTAQVAASIMSFVRDSVRDEVETVLGRALPAEPARAPAPRALLPAAKVVKALPPAKKPSTKAAKPKAPKIECSKQRCHGSWYRPSGGENKLCYEHFLEAGGKAPPGKKLKKK